MSKDFEWLDRTLVRNPYHYCLCISEKGYNEVLKKLEVPKAERPHFLAEGSLDASVTKITGNKFGFAAVVCIEASEQKDDIAAFGALAHEAQHVWHLVVDHIGEYQPSDEFSAYSVGGICENLFRSYVRQTKKKNKKVAK